MSGYTVAHLDDIDEISDGRCPWRPVRHHFGIMSFGVNAWTARDAGDRIINEHDGPAQPALRGRRVRRGRRPRARADRGPSRVRRLLYNLACCESLAGRTADAIEHLRVAIERAERFRSFAAGDCDFDPIRAEPAFKELVG